MGKDEAVERGETRGRYSRIGIRAGEVSSLPPIREFSCSDVWLAVKADRQIAANYMCWESSQRWANDRRGGSRQMAPVREIHVRYRTVVLSENI